MLMSRAMIILTEYCMGTHQLKQKIGALLQFALHVESLDAQK
jgi:hypothetical protein